MGKRPTAAVRSVSKDFKSFKQLIDLFLELDKYVLNIILKIINYINMNKYISIKNINVSVSSKYIKGQKGTDTYE